MYDRNISIQTLISTLIRNVTLLQLANELGPPVVYLVPYHFAGLFTFVVDCPKRESSVAALSIGETCFLFRECCTLSNIG